jgi:myo-inositol-1(or 4)-monophosphatase
MLTTTDLLHCLDAAKDAARLAAAVLEEWRPRFSVHEKARHDLVTDADFASQQAIYNHLHERFPDHQFLGEEDAKQRARPGPESAPTWIVDPLDGTTNYVHDLPFYCVSIGLEAGGELAAGVVFDPSRQEMFAGARGLGAWLNHRRLTVSKTATLGDAMLATGFPPDMRGQEIALAWWRHFSLRARSLRRTGSTALNLAYIAAGRFDGYFAFDNHVWDVAAAAVLVREAGGQVTNADGTPFDPYTPDALGSNGVLHPQLLEEFQARP